MNADQPHRPPAGLAGTNLPRSRGATAAAPLPDTAVPSASRCPNHNSRRRIHAAHTRTRCRVPLFSGTICPARISGIHRP